MRTLKPGEVCAYIDKIDPESVVNCTVKMVEPDMEIPGLVYYYLIANDESLNDKIDPRFPWRFFLLTDNQNQDLIPLTEFEEIIVD